MTPTLWLVAPFLTSLLLFSTSSQLTYTRNTEVGADTVIGDTIQEKITHYEQQYKIPTGHLLALVECETAGTFDSTIQSYAKYKDGTREQSYGLAQIHLKAWPETTMAQATDPDYALRFIGDHWEERHKLWVTCTKKLAI